MTARKFRVLLIGAGVTGTQVLNQLHKNPDILIIVADPRPEPKAVADGIIKKVDITETLTPLTLKEIFKQSAPDLVLLAMAPQDMGLGGAAGLDIMAEELQKEIAAISDVPVIQVARAKH